MTHTCRHEGDEAALGSASGVENDEHVDSARRGLLRGSGVAAAAMIAAPLLLTRKAGALPSGPTRDVLVFIFLRGGADGLTIVPPYGDPEYYLRRPTLAIPQPGQTNGAVPLPGSAFFGLAPAALPLLGPYTDGKLAIVHATGLVDPSRSHFDAQLFMELGTNVPSLAGRRVGWLARHLQTSAPVASEYVRGIALLEGLPRSLVGAPGAFATVDPASFTLPGQAATLGERRQRVSAMFAPDDRTMHGAAHTTLEAADRLGAVDFAGYVPANGAVYPTTALGGQLKATAAMINAGVGLEVYSIDYDRAPGWDFHANLGPITGKLATKLSDLSRSLAAFYTDLKTGALANVTVVCISEFGRRAYENASAGTDHGHGGIMLVMGGQVNGGQVFANWPGLALPQLDDGDLAITMDHRDVLAEILVKRLGNPNLGIVLPNYTPTFHGIVN